ncbi:NUDIX hydrolase [Phenylobacterium aquaticum]|uniref:NUDIX hydrolase n=1 Tax=Phenylobacterium aquaticum TaxID=1763816 RepID=UPI0026F3426B|nr:NUDIX hydrolase [Phenylobacterium aquaticum]
MSDPILAKRPPEGGRQRAPGTPAVRPRDAATLFIVRRDGAKPRVLMGKRHGGHDFMPNLWVFPGGRIDKADFRAPYATDLTPDVAAKLEGHKGSRGRALALAAVRETFEEAGLLLARKADPRPIAGPWREFLAQGALPDLEALSIIYRAVTPPMLAKRFDTWFLMADAERLISLDRQPDCGELEEIAWFEFDDALELPLPMVTRAVIKETVARLEDPGRPVPYMRFTAGAPRMRHL